MTKFPLILLAASLFCTQAALALDPNTVDKSRLPANSAPKSTAAAKAKEPEPEATPAPKKRGLMGRVFGKKTAPEAVTPAPATPAPEPAATPRSRRKPRALEDAQESAAAKSKKQEPEKVAEKTPAAASEKAPEPAVTAPKGKKGAKTPVAAVKKPANQPPETTDPEVLEKWKLGEAKTKALEDPELRAIKSKADAAATDEESRKTLRVYNKALFGKIREIDPSIKERASQMEAAILKQLAEAE